MEVGMVSKVLSQNNVLQSSFLCIWFDIPYQIKLNLFYKFSRMPTPAFTCNAELSIRSRIDGLWKFEISS